MFKNQIQAILSMDYSSKSNFRGVYAMDRLPVRQQGAYVINTDDHDQPGAHWIAVFDDGYNVEYMDSYGRPPLDLRCVQFLGPCYSYNTVTLQQLFSTACGFYCVYYLMQRSCGFSSQKIISMLSQCESGYVVKNFIYSRFKPVFN